MKTKALLTTAFLIFDLGFYVSAQKATVKASLEPTEIKVGQQAILTLEATHDDQTAIIWPALTETISPKIELIKHDKIDTSFSEDKKTIRFKQKLYVTSFDSGAFTIPPFPFMYFSGADTLTLYTDSLLLSSATLPVDTLLGFRDITNPLDVPFSFLELIPYVLIVLAVVVVALALYFWIQRIKKKKYEEKPAPVIAEPAHIIALRELKALKEKKLWQQGQVKTYYIELTDIIRRYLHNHFTIDATEMTTDEILNSLKLTDSSSECLLAITRLLRLADLVKFAKAQPIEAEHEDAFRQANKFVELTAINSAETT